MKFRTIFESDNRVPDIIQKKRTPSLLHQDLTSLGLNHDSGRYNGRVDAHKVDSVLTKNGFFPDDYDHDEDEPGQYGHSNSSGEWRNPRTGHSLYVDKDDSEPAYHNISLRDGEWSKPE